MLPSIRTYILAAYAIAYVLVHPHSVQPLLAVACHAPAVPSWLNLACSQRPVHQPPDYQALVALQVKFEANMESTLTGSGTVSVELRNAQVAIRDLNSLVSAINIPRLVLILNISRSNSAI